MECTIGVTLVLKVLDIAKAEDLFHGAEKRKN